MYLDFHKFHEFDLRYNPAHMFLVNAYGDLINLGVRLIFLRHK